MRLFAALPLPRELVEAIGGWRVEACTHLPAGDWRDLPRENWHLTLAFYGDVGGRQADSLAEALEECACSALPLQLQLAGFGVFPKPARANVFWIGVEDAAAGGALASLAGCCRRAGFATVRKRGAKSEPFRGHVTLARRRGFPDVLPMDALAAMPQAPAMAWEAKYLQLICSTLHKDGARYQVCEEFTLGESGQSGG
jgi:2'-5' RNA ligase